MPFIKRNELRRYDPCGIDCTIIMHTCSGTNFCHAHAQAKHCTANANCAATIRAALYFGTTILHTLCGVIYRGELNTPHLPECAINCAATIRAALYFGTTILHIVAAR